MFVLCVASLRLAAVLILPFFVLFFVFAFLTLFSSLFFFLLIFLNSDAVMDRNIFPHLASSLVIHVYENVQKVHSSEPIRSHFTLIFRIPKHKSTCTSSRAVFRFEFLLRSFYIFSFEFFSKMYPFRFSLYSLRFLVEFAIY